MTNDHVVFFVPQSASREFCNGNVPTNSADLLGAPNILFLVHHRQAPAHIVMADMSSWLVACSSNTLGERQRRNEIKGDEDPANLTRELNIPICQGDGAGCSLDARFGEKQTTSLMRSDVTSAALLRLTMKPKRELAAL